jgi:DNA-binding XRE family transcriptional regulator
VGASVEASVSQLPARYRAILELRYTAGLEWTEVAEVLGISPAHARKMHERAVKALKTLPASQPSEQPPATDATFGEIMRHFRVEAGLSQEALAERIGLSVRGINDLEHGRKTQPQFETVRLHADALDLDPPQRAILVSAARLPAAHDERSRRQ